MTPHVLTMILMLANGTVVETRVGIITNKPICELAGLGIATVLIEEEPALTVGWTCEPEGIAA